VPVGVPVQGLFLPQVPVQVPVKFARTFTTNISVYSLKTQFFYCFSKDMKSYWKDIRFPYRLLKFKATS
jgi:hypothetical protein